MKIVELNQINNIFKEMSQDWFLITAKANDRIGTMTASWGGIGIMWNKPVVYTVLRPQRHTKSILDKADSFSLSFLKPEFHDKHMYFGKVSGHNEDKITTAGLDIEYSLDTPYFKDSTTVYICKKLFAQPYDPSCFIDTNHINTMYPNKDYHTLYISEILQVLQ